MMVLRNYFQEKAYEVGLKELRFQHREGEIDFFLGWKLSLPKHSASKPKVY